MGNPEYLIMIIEHPDWSEPKVSDRIYPAEQIKAWVHRVRLEHQLTDTTRHLRKPTEEELATIPIQDDIFDMRAVSSEVEDFS